MDTGEAILLEARNLHPNHADIAFNLACHAFLKGNVEEAKVRLRHAIDLDKEIRSLGLEEEDLRPLWDWIRSLE